MGEYFTLIGLMGMSLIPAVFFLVVPAIIIGIGWSLAIYLMLDRGIAPGEALIQSNKATYGYKWTIFGINFVLLLLSFILIIIFNTLNTSFGFLLTILTTILIQVVSLACMGIIYRDLTKKEEMIQL